MLAALAAGASFALGGAPRAWWWASAAGLVGLYLVLTDAWARPGPRPIRDGALAGAAFGVGANAVALSWSVALLERLGGFPRAAALATAALLFLAQAVPHALAGLWGGAVEARAPGRGWLAHAAGLVVASSLTPAVFPWRVGVTQLAALPVAQLAELGGEPLVDLFTLLVAGAVARAATRPDPRPALVAAVAAGAVVAWGAHRIDAVRALRGAAPPLAVGVVQPNVPPGGKRRPGLRGDRLDALHAATRRLEARGADVVVWPETAHPWAFPRAARRDLPRPFAACGPGVRGPLLVGAITRGGDAGSGRPRRYNSVLSIDRRGRVLGASDKVVLVPFGERIPLCGTLLPARWFEAFGGCGLTPGRRPRVLPAAGARVGVLNCYEDVLGAQAHRVAGDRPEILVNVTNDGWFGDTDEPHLHLLVSRMRAIEARRDLVRATNTGVSAHVLATGEVAAAAPVSAPDAFFADARRLTLATPWTRRGDWPTPALAGALTGSALALRPRRRRRGRARPRRPGPTASR